MPMTSTDIAELQRKINARLKSRRPSAQITVDGELGPETDEGERIAGWLMGVEPASGSKKAQARRRAVIRGARRTPAELKRARQRKAREKKLQADAKRASGNGPRIVRGPGGAGQGPLGTPVRVIGHYTGGPLASSLKHCLALFGQYARMHTSYGWGGIGYHFGIHADGTLVLLRPVANRGCHTAGTNTGSIGIVMHGTTGDRATAAQRATLRWLAANAHTSRMPASHRTSKKLSGLPWKGHNDFNATACPGAMKRAYTSKGATA